MYVYLVHVTCILDSSPHRKDSNTWTESGSEREGKSRTAKPCHSAWTGPHRSNSRGKKDEGPKITKIQIWLRLSQPQLTEKQAKALAKWSKAKIQKPSQTDTPPGHLSNSSVYTPTIPGWLPPGQYRVDYNNTPKYYQHPCPSVTTPLVVSWQYQNSLTAVEMLLSSLADYFKGLPISSFCPMMSIFPIMLSDRIRYVEWICTTGNLLFIKKFNNMGYEVSH